MNFSDSEKPVVLRFVDLMIRAQERREQEWQSGAGWGCCDGSGRMYYVDHKPSLSRKVLYCPSCNPLFRQPHRCMLKSATEARAWYWEVVNGIIKRQTRIVKRQATMAHKQNLADVARIRKAYDATHPYRKGVPLSDYRSRWKDLTIQYWTIDGEAYLYLAGERRIEPREVLDVRSALDVPTGAVCVMPKEPREDGSWVVKVEWQTAKQAAMVLA